MPKDSKRSGFYAMSDPIIPHSRPTLTGSESKAVSSVLESGQIAQGPKVHEFEKQFSGYIGRKEAAATSSGTAALHLALLALGVTDKDEIIVPSFVCTAVLNAVLYTGANPVVVDIDPETHNISVDSVKRAVTKQTKAVIVPHMFGCPAEIEKLSELGIPVIEDCAQSVGSDYDGQKAGSFGILSVFSFYATKVFTTGEGGMVVSDSEELVSRVKDLREYDNKQDYAVRFNTKMTDFQAALGLNQLSHLEEFLDKREMIADRYFSEFKDCGFSLPVRKKGREHIYYRFVVKTEDEASLSLERLQQKGIMCQRPVFVPLHVCLGLSGFSHTMEIWQSAISIPLYPSLTEEEIEKIIAVVREIF
jgi:dTDP-4-amino-4,6-dideoxygalactose transaminase